MTEKVDILIEGGTILTIDDERRIFTDGSVAIEGNKIVAVGKTEHLRNQYKAERKIDAKGKVVMPGLIDCHYHIMHGPLKSIAFGDRETGLVWMRFFLPFESSLKEEEASIAATLSCIQMIKSGTTCFAEIGPNRPEYSDIVAQVVEKAGIRSAIARGSFDHPMDAYTRTIPGMEKTEDSVKNNEAFIRRWNGKAEGRIRAWVGAQSIFLNSDEYFIKNKELADKYKVGVHSHLNYSRDEIKVAYSRWGKRPLEHLSELGILGPNFMAAHMVMLTERELQIVEESKMNLVHNPLPNIAYSFGVMKLPQLLNRGIKVGLGTDTNSGDYFDALKLIPYIHLIAWGFQYQDHMPVSFEDAIEMATINGAKTLLWNDEIGSIQPGKKADMILVDFDQPHLSPSHNLPAELVCHTSGRDVDTVIIDGKVVMENRLIATVNEEEVLEKARNVTSEVLSRAGVKRLSPFLNKFKAV
jgi:5-methylthioadenosine/S-adenosylhomocysteine deaminase